MKKQNGLTLLEVLIVIAILSIVTAIGIPSFRAFLERGNLSAASNNIIAVLNTARIEAIRRGDKISIASASGTNWSGSNTIYYDTNGNGSFNSTQDEVLRIMDPAAESVSVKSNGTANVNFLATGFVTAPVSFTVCPQEDTIGRKIDVLISGRVNVDSNFDCSTLP